MVFEIPQACTLPTVERPGRLAELDELLADSVRCVERNTDTHLTVRLRNHEGLDALVRDLVARESGCCSFFDFAVTEDADDLVLGIGVPTRHASILDSLQSRAGAIA